VRALILVILWCASIFGAESDIRIAATVRTNKNAKVSTKEVFTREGQTNLVRDIATKAGVVQIRIHRFYYSGELIGTFVDMRDSSGFTSEAGTQYSITFEFDAARNPRSAVIGTKDGIAVEAFGCTNGLFFPMQRSVLEKANSVGEDMKLLFDPEHVRSSTPESFRGEVEKLIQKHKEK
jgi:hypothetical protein